MRALAGGLGCWCWCGSRRRGGARPGAGAVLVGLRCVVEVLRGAMQAGAVDRAGGLEALEVYSSACTARGAVNFAPGFDYRRSQLCGDGTAWRNSTRIQRVTGEDADRRHSYSRKVHRAPSMCHSPTLRDAGGILRADLPGILCRRPALSLRFAPPLPGVRPSPPPSHDLDLAHISPTSPAPASRLARADCR